jgi:hypothetical protein
MKLHKILKWEFWPVWVFYVPVYAYWAWLAFRARSWSFFTASNPTMEMGGFFDYSKYKILMQIPLEFRPITILIHTNESLENALMKIQNADIEFPCIIKPDKGERGFGVEKIDNKAQLQQHLEKYKAFDLVAQELIDEPLEFGVMYYRFPNEATGNINSVVQKEFLFLTGDGKTTFQNLLLQNQRTLYHYEMLCQLHQKKLQMILAKGEVFQLISIGNHSRGTTFLNANSLINKDLVDIFDKISNQIEGYYFGRYDLRVKTIEDLYAGKVKIMELNGANSEPAHIYDPNMGIWEAYKHLLGQWKILWKISVQNHKKGIPYMPIGEMIKKIRANYRFRKVNLNKS